jgi:mono/diheme cytochrome c family protein
MRTYRLLTALMAVSAWGQGPRFERDVLPIFTANCFSCHGGSAMVGLDLRTAVSTLRGSHEGPVIVKGSAEQSRLYEKVASRAMPPPAFNLKLTDAEIETIKRWIDAGAPSDEADASAERWKQAADRFEKEALPILEARCVACHGAGQPMGGLDLRTLASLLEGSANGPVIEEGVADKSILIRKIASGAMPPPGAGKLTEAEVEKLRRWIDTTRFGARETVVERTAFSEAEAPPVTEKDRAFWAFRKPVKAPPPPVKARARVRTPVDAFILSKLESKGLTLSPEAAPRTLLRRAYLDLTGLPPSPEEIDEFLADTRPGAYERLIDRLLDSPHYGERQARHWLDAAGYVDVGGFDNDLPGVELFEGMWRYRDYVVRAFNTDKPYDRFLIEQLAGDEVTDWRNAIAYTPEVLDGLIATGYLRSVYDRTDADIVNLVGERYDVLFHLMEKVSTSVMGLTVGCARCHSHKFDPIPKRDYYRMLAVFTPAYNPMDWKQPKHRYLADVPKTEEEAIARHNEEIARPLTRLEEQRANLRQPYEEKLLDQKLTALPEAIRAETKNAVQTPAEKRDEVQKFLAAKFERMLKVSPEEVAKAISSDDRAADERLARQVETLKGYKRSFGKVQALWDVGPPPATRLLQRGAVESPGPRVTPGGLEVLSAPGAAELGRSPDARGETSGVRLAFAEWLTSRDHPLTARVMVNRVWMHSFGRGIVETPENFGHQGAPPTHPELLDWLAADLMENGWRLKRLHRLIVTSSVYRQASRRPKGQTLATEADPENHLLWRMSLRRLDAEAIRDAVLAASGKLDRTMGGPPAILKPRSDGLQDIQGPQPGIERKWRRSLYVMARRNWPLNLLQVFDFPTMQVNCTRRIQSATPLQSLAMLNDEFVVEEAGHMAERVAEMAGGTARAQIEAAYLVALARRPSNEEVTLGKAYLEQQERLYRFGNVPAEKSRQQALASLCQTLFSTNEFLYVD